MFFLLVFGCSYIKFVMVGVAEVCVPWVHESGSSVGHFSAGGFNLVALRLALCPSCSEICDLRSVLCA